MTRTIYMTALWTAVLLAADVASQQKLQRGIDLMETKGDLPAAMAMFQEAARSSDRPTAARALLYLAQCEERQGKDRAEATYRRIEKEFSDQRDVAERARERLAAITAPLAPAGHGLITRQLWTGPDVDSEGMPTADGRHVAVVHWDTGDLAVKDLSTGELKRLLLKKSWKDSTDFGEWPVLSPDERQIVFAWWDPRSDRYQLRIAANQSGAKARVLIDKPEYAYFTPAGWSPDDKAVAAVLWGPDFKAEIAWVSTSDGAIHKLRSLEWRDPTINVSQDGRYIAYDAVIQQNSRSREIHVLAADGSSDNVVAKSPGIDFDPVWSADAQHLVFVSDRSGSLALWSVAIRDGKADGAPELLKSDTGWIFPKIFTHSGSLLYFHDRSDLNIMSASLQGHAAPVRLIDSYVGQNSAAAYSHDGKMLAYLSRRTPSARSNGRNAVLVVRDLATGRERVFPSEIGVTGEAPVWFQGDRAILHGTRDVKGRVSFYKLDLATGRQTPVPVKVGVRAVFALSGDGRTVYAGSREDGPPGAGIYAIDLQSGDEKLIHRLAPKDDERVRYYVGSMAMSPDGRTLACIVQAASPTGTNRELLLMNPDGSNVRTLLRTAGEGPGALFPSFGAVAWSPDGKDLYVVRLKEHRGSSNILEVHRLAPERGSATTPTGIVASQIRFLSVDPTGAKIAFTTGAQQTSELWSLDNALTTLSAAR